MVEQFEKLFRGYSALKILKPNGNLENLKELIFNFKPFLERIKIDKKDNATNYNIFEVLRIEFYEAKVHSPFIANLLDIHGSHCQQELFYDLFIDFFVPKVKQDLFKTYAKDYLSCRIEKREKESQPDIIIEHLHPVFKNRFAFIIENKIFAIDQPKQIERYYDLLINKGYCYDQLLIFYLKPVAEEPSEVSISLKLKEELINNESLVYIDYKDNISKWLSESLKKVEAVNLKTIISQYLESIKRFTNE